MGPTGASLTAYTVYDALQSGFGTIVIVTRPDIRAPLESHLETQLGPGLPIRWVYQRTDDVPEAHRGLVPGRRKPWGTGQAVLACRTHLTGAFAVANADDWYGPEALAALVRALGALPKGPPCPGVLVGFPMIATLPPTGAGVSRGWIRLRSGGDGPRGPRGSEEAMVKPGEPVETAVEGVLELLETARLPATASSAERPPLAGTDPKGRQVRVPDTAWASMNLWGFGACALPLLASGFREFLDREGSARDAEFALSSAVDALIAQGTLGLRLLPEGRRWFGITHPEDAPWVKDRLRALHADGTYPDSLVRGMQEPGYPPG